MKSIKYVISKLYEALVSYTNELKEMERMKIKFGVLAPKLGKQLQANGFKDEKLEHHERAIKCCLVLWFGGYITDSERTRIETKIVKDISKTMKPIKGDGENGTQQNL